MLVIWGFYGVAATFGTVNKNISYNTLDIIAKNFYGLFIYYVIVKLGKKETQNNEGIKGFEGWI